MKTLSLLAAAAAALSFSASVTPAATLKPFQGPVQGSPAAKPSAIYFLSCRAAPPGPTARLAVSHVYIRNSSGLNLRKGMRIYVDVYLKNGGVQTTSFVLVQDLPKNAVTSTMIHGHAVRCRAQVNVLAKKEPVPIVPVPR